jgi:hypothetical protein
MTPDQIRSYLRAYKDFHLPPWRRWCSLAFIVSYAAGFSLFIYNSKRLMPAHKGPRTFKAIIRKGTALALLVNVGFWGGLRLVSGLDWITYMRGSLDMQNHLAARTIKHNTKFQDYFLFPVMERFGVSEEIRSRVKLDLEQEKGRMMEKGLISERELYEQEEKLDIEVVP